MTGESEPVPAVLRPSHRGLEAAGSDLSIRRLQAFWAVAHTGSMTKAAKLMGISRPQVYNLMSAHRRRA